MSEATDLLDALKGLLRERGLTYADAAQALGLSEASVKRLFSQRTFALERVEALCELAGADIAELVARAELPTFTVRFTV